MALPKELSSVPPQELAYQATKFQDLVKLLKLRLEHDDFIKFQLFLAVFLSNSIELMIFLSEIVRVLYEDGQKAMSKSYVRT